LDKNPIWSHKTNQFREQPTILCLGFQKCLERGSLRNVLYAPKQIALGEAIGNYVRISILTLQSVFWFYNLSTSEIMLASAGLVLFAWL
jgi:hypothetical protein